MCSAACVRLVCVCVCRRLDLWRNYILAALTSARAVCGKRRTLLLNYEAWQKPSTARAQYGRLLAFLKCAGVRLSSTGGEEVLSIVRPAEKHHDAGNISRLAQQRSTTARQPPPSVGCLFRELESGRALQWPGWDARRKGFRAPPCTPRAHAWD